MALNNLKISVARNKADIDLCLALRRTVFIDEQGVSEAEERDGLDDICTHILAKINTITPNASVKSAPQVPPSSTESPSIDEPLAYSMPRGDALVGAIPVGTARLLYSSDSRKERMVKVQRVCVLGAFRGNDYGAAIMRFIIEMLGADGAVRYIRLGAQM